MLLLHRTDRQQKGAIENMNAYAVFAVNEHIEYLLAEAAQRRTYQSDTPNLFRRIASAASHALGVLAKPTDTRGAILPKLERYPYRG